MNRSTHNVIFRHTIIDVIPVIAGILHFAFVWDMILEFGHRSLWVNAGIAFIYAISISWNINSVSHNFIHNPYFTKTWMNKLFSLIESLAIGFSQTLYHWVHVQHHIGNSDRQDKKGNTRDWLSIYRFGKDGRPEGVWSYTFLSFFRDDIKDIFENIKRKSRFNAYWGMFELYAFFFQTATFALISWKALLFMLPFYYLGNCLSSLNGYYEHLHGNPDVPLAWGVSNYNRLYNWLWFGNGYHAEHHYRPRMHWTKMHNLHEEIKEEQRKANVHTISMCHALGFLAKENLQKLPEQK